MQYRLAPNARKHPTLSTTTPTQATDEAERTARHVRLSREMGELAMDLACAAAARAKRDLAAESGPQQSPETAKPTSRNTPDASQLFTRLCRIIETAIALEARLAKGLIPATPQLRSAPAAAPANPLPRPPLSPSAAALSASTSLAAPLTPPWQPKQAAPAPAVTANPPLPGLPKATLNGTTPTLSPR